MKRVILFILIGLAILIVACGLLGLGFAAGRVLWGMPGGWLFNRGTSGFYGMPMHNWGYNNGLWGNSRDFRGRIAPYSTDNPGTLGNSTCGGDPLGSCFAEPSTGATLTLSQAEQAVEGYLARFDAPLEIGEIMIFDNQGYAEIIETDTGIGAMEVLVDPASLRVYPEYGPNRMWNQKYGMMSGMMGYSNWDAATSMTVTEPEAIELAQEYLDRTQPGLEVEQHVDPFYGYYTLHTLRDGEVVGMLSVHGYTGQVFLHHWHGTFIEMTEEHEE